MTPEEILKSLGFTAKPRNNGEFTLEKANHTFHLFGPLSNGEWCGEVYSNTLEVGEETFEEPEKVLHLSAFPFASVLAHGMFYLGKMQGREKPR